MNDKDRCHLAETLVPEMWLRRCPIPTVRLWIVAWTGMCNLRGDGLVTIGFKTGSRGVESEAIYTMLEVSASKFECECEQ